MKTLLKTSALLCVVASLVNANVTISSASYQEEMKVMESGKKTTTWVKATKVVPGTLIRYVNALDNLGKQKAEKLVVKNPIPENMEYVASSASCQTACSLSYSVDGGKSYKQAEDLYVGTGEERHLAQASEYTDIKWVLDSLAATSQSSVEYKARLK